MPISQVDWWSILGLRSTFSSRSNTQQYQVNIAGLLSLNVKARVVWLGLLSAACDSAAMPPCPYMAEEPKQPANAGCMIVSDSQALWVQDWRGRWAWPGGTRKEGESARCTAWRETGEETGWSVQVGQLVRVYDNDFHLFHCTVEQAVAAKPLTPRDRREIQQAIWIPHSEILSLRLRFPEYRSLVLEDIAQLR